MYQQYPQIQIVSTLDLNHTMNLKMMKPMMFSTRELGINFLSTLILLFFCFFIALRNNSSNFHSDHKFFSLSNNSSSIADCSMHRRHSVGTFAGKDKICTTSFIDEAPLEQAPRAPTYHKRTYRGKQ
jgi:hypothetical protein